MITDIEKIPLVVPVKTKPGDKVVVEWVSADGKSERIEKDITEEAEFDTLMLAKFTDEFGLSYGYVGVIGKE